MEIEKYYVEKYANDDAFMNGEMSSCKLFTSEDKAIAYFNKMINKYKKGILVLSKEDEEGYPEIIEEVTLN